MVNVTGTVSPPDAHVMPPARVQLRITEVGPPVMVSFERAAYSLAEGNRVTVRVRFNAPAGQTFTIHLVKTHRDGATEVDYSGLPESLTFDPSDTEQSFSFSALPDTESDDGENVLLEFGTPLPMGVIAGSPAQATLTISTRPPPPPPPPPEREEETTTTTTSTGGGGGGSFSFGGGAAAVGPPRLPALVGQQFVTRVFAPLLENGTLERVWRFNNEDKSWTFYDPRPVFAQFNTLRLVTPPVILIVRVTRAQVFRGEQISAGWNYINVR